MTTKEILYYSNALSEGTTDKIRDNFGATYTSGEETHFSVASGNLDPFLENIMSNKGIWDPSPNESKISRTVVKQRNKQNVINDILSYPTVRTPILLIGDSTLITDDLEWNKIIVGGEYANTSYAGLFQTGLLEGIQCRLNVPYDKMEAKVLKGDNYTSLEYSTIETLYQTHIAESQNNNRSIYLLPNFYSLLRGSSVNTNNSFTDEMKNYTYLNEQYSILSIGFIFSESSYSWPSAQPMKDSIYATTQAPLYSDLKHNINKYYKRWANIDFDITTTDYIEERMRNVIFDTESLQVDSIDKYTAILPQSVKFTLNKSNFHNNAGMIEVITEASAENLILSYIKDSFVDNDPKSVANSTVVNTELGETAGTSELKYLDFNDFLIKEIKSPAPFKQDFLFLTDDAIEANMLYDINGDYRYYRTGKAAKLITNIRNKLNTEMTPLTFPFHRITDTGEGNWTLNNFLDIPNDPDKVLSDIIAFRIEKIGNVESESGIPGRQPIQNFYMFSSEDRSDINFVDTQIKYGEDYTYNTYAYKAVISYRYKYSNFKVSKQIGTNGNNYCLQFYDPISGDITDLEWLAGNEPDTFSNFFNKADSEFATNSEVMSAYKFASETILEIEPVIRIYEIPIYTKDITVLDTPPRQIDVSTYQRKDDSQVIGFYARKDSFIKKVYPNTLGNDEAAQKTKYLNSNNMLSTEKITEPSVSAIRYVQVYRIDERPKSIQDFNNFLIDERDLLSKKSAYVAADTEEFFSTTQTASTVFYEEKVKTNKTYYYLFRFLNENRVPGEFSQIQEVRLVDDGGYKYITTNSLTEQDLNDGSIYENPAISFKKLIQLIPNINQVQLDTTNVDFEKESFTQIDNLGVGTAEDKIWNKTYKIRMTSKKTGKKIDLNVTYNLKSLTAASEPEELPPEAPSTVELPTPLPSPWSGS
tara:strand:+ start:27671 stop:30451 length:2781 start_codon:yes stop_codon:yes gene_type:complete